MVWTIQKLLTWATEYFQSKGIDSPRLDAELLLGHVLQIERIQLYTQFDRPLQEEELQTFKALLQRRATREPLAYILGEKEFFSLKMEVGPEVLVPRPETEGVVERGIEHLNKSQSENLRILDLATGSGCLLIALLKQFPSARGVGVDVSGKALELASANARKHGLESQVRWVRQDLSVDWSQELEGPFDLITANLPYVSEEEYISLQPEIRNFEPKGALVPGPQGTEAFTWVLPRLASRLKKGGLILLEIGADQGSLLSDLAGDLAPDLGAETLPDLAGRDRILALQ